MLKRHHIRAFRQTVFSSLVLVIIGGGMFFVLRPSVFLRASNENVSQKAINELSPEDNILKMPDVDIFGTNSNSASEEISSDDKRAINTYSVRPQGLPSYNVSTVVDGNTIILDKKTRVRLVGIKAPEKDEEYGMDAYEFLRKIVEGKDIYFQRDEKNPKDEFGRMRGIIYLEKKNINIEILRNGFAHTYTITPSIVDYDAWDIYEVEAREAKRGLWSGLGENSPDKEKKDSEAVSTDSKK